MTPAEIIRGYRDNDHSDDWLEAELVKAFAAIRDECAKERAELEERVHVYETVYGGDTGQILSSRK
jgi:hypothetical protein